LAIPPEDHCFITTGGCSLGSTETVGKSSDQFRQSRVFDMYVTIVVIDAITVEIAPWR
jgi:hypothetical protein